MKYPRFLLACLGLVAALWAGAVQALPTVDQVQAAAQRGDYAGAEKMMREVVAARPDSARAHYVLAEILARERQFNEAAEHTRRARSLDPAIKFTDPARFKAFEQLLQREQVAAAKPAAPTPLEATAAPPQQRAAPAAAAESSSGGGVPVWMVVVGAVAFIALAAAWMRRRAAAPAAPPALAGGYGMGSGYGPVMPQQGPMGGGGSGLMGVGLAAAGGVAAGMLAERLWNSDHDGRGTAHQADAGAGAGAGGLIPGSFGGDDSAATELTHRDIDFGSGDGWGGSDAGGDFGGGGGDDW